MLILLLLSLLIATPLSSSNISPVQLTRVTSVSFFFAALLSLNIYNIQTIESGVSLYSGLFHVSLVSLTIEIFILILGGIILLPWASYWNKSSLLYTYNKGKDGFLWPIVAEYPIILVFTTIGALFLISSTDLVSLYLSIELQSFAVYVLATLYRNSETATSAGLKYFLLGALSSAFILLGSSLIYTYTGLTNLDGISSLISVPTSLSDNISGGVTQGVLLGIVIMTIGFLFKVAAAPFHNWAPDVYDGVPTIVTTWLMVMPKISIFVLLLTLHSVTESIGLPLVYLGEGVSINVWQGLLLLSSLLSLVIGTVVGLAQFRIKRLMSYSTISHVGFLLLALGVSNQESIDAFLFYMIQYSLTTLNVFLILLAFGYVIHNQRSINGLKTDIQLISQLSGQFRQNPLLVLSIAICLFSIAGIPPLIGFFAKYAVLYTSIHNGYYFLSLIGILASVVSAAYYLRVVRVLYFDDLPSTSLNESPEMLTNTHSYFISVLTFFIVFFILQPSLILNSTQLMAMSIYGY